MVSRTTFRAKGLMRDAAYIRRGNSVIPSARGQNPQLRRKYSGFDHSHGEALRRRWLSPPRGWGLRTPGAKVARHCRARRGPFPEQISMRIKRDQEAGPRFDRMRCSGKPHTACSRLRILRRHGLPMHRDDRSRTRRADSPWSRSGRFHCKHGISG